MNENVSRQRFYNKIQFALVVSIRLSAVCCDCHVQSYFGWCNNQRCFHQTNKSMAWLEHFKGVSRRFEQYLWYQVYLSGHIQKSIVYAIFFSILCIFCFHSYKILKKNNQKQHVNIYVTHCNGRHLLNAFLLLKSLLIGIELKLI